MPQNLPFGERSISIPPNGIAADLRIPVAANALVIFAHGSGSSRLSTRNQFVAGVLNRAGFATLLLDLLTAAEEEVDLRTFRLRFDVDLLANRLAEATAWAKGDPEIARFPIAYFGASTGAAAALIAAAGLPNVIRGVVSRGGRPDLAGEALVQVKAPTLLIVGGDDVPVIELNEQAFRQLLCEKKLEIVPRATHLFQEPGALERVAKLASDWLQQHLTMTLKVRSVCL